LHEAVSVCDALAPADFLLHSLLGRNDGQLYKHLAEYLGMNSGNSSDKQ
uniref:ACOX domain-containing protein n=1 Tax=Gongylonema pulchrum TaxID=637853 RepID=A0A183F1G3_9BILA